MSYFFDYERIVQEIRKRNAKRVLLQFPEGLKPFSTDAVESLNRRLPEVEFVISGEPSWGACDVAEDEARIVGVDLIVHFGHTPYTWYYPKFPTLFIEAESNLDVDEEAVKQLKNKLREYGTKKVSLTSTIQHYKLLDKIRYKLDGFEVVIGNPSSPFMHPGQVLGCDYKAANVEADVYVNVSGGVFHALGLGLSTLKPTLKLDPYTNKVEDLTQEVNRILRVRYSKIMKAMDARTWVIIQGVKVGQNRPLMVKYLEKRLREMGNTVYVVTNKVLNVDVLRNIDRSNIDAYVVTSCPRLPIDDLYNYEKPVLTPGEAKMIILNKLEPYIFPW
ncbi:MAG: diphthamide biosynthesis enzyme Dph2 [Candidatus Aramenus sp.]|nr:diphthamide biosynthesis enzyme Dph2 [Candidatus Aramenus sp.]